MEEQIKVKQANDASRKVYVKPVLSVVGLRAEEAVLASCKLGTGLGVRDTCRTAGDLSCISMQRS